MLGAEGRLLPLLLQNTSQAPEALMLPVRPFRTDSNIEAVLAPMCMPRTRKHPQHMRRHVTAWKNDI